MLLCSEEDWNNSSTLEDEPYMLSKVGAWCSSPACHYSQLHNLCSGVHALPPREAWLASYAVMLSAGESVH